VRTGLPLLYNVIWLGSNILEVTASISILPIARTRPLSFFPSQRPLTQIVQLVTVVIIRRLHTRSGHSVDIARSPSEDFTGQYFPRGPIGLTEFGQVTPVPSLRGRLREVHLLNLRHSHRKSSRAPTGSAGAKNSA
jgi:hypothetical protein